MDRDTWLAEANQQLARLKELTSQIGLQFVDLPAHSMGAGFGVAYGEHDYAVVSVGAQNASHPYITSGVLHDLDRDNKLGILEACNTVVSEGKGVPVFLHDADAGWDVIAQMTVPAQLLFDVPPYYQALLRGVVDTATEVRPTLAEAGIHGQPYHWDNLDAERLLSRSLI